MDNSKKKRINAYISKKNYNKLSELIDNHKLMTMRLSKGAVLDLALTNLFSTLKNGESIENIAIQHLEGCDSYE